MLRRLHEEYGDIYIQCCPPYDPCDRHKYGFKWSDIEPYSRVSNDELVQLYRNGQWNRPIENVELPSYIENDEGAP